MFKVASIRGRFDSIESTLDPLPLRQARHAGTIGNEAARPFAIRRAFPSAEPAFDFELPSRPVRWNVSS